MANEVTERIERIKKEIKDWEFCKIKIQQEIMKRKLAIRDLEEISDIKNISENIPN